jgi:hypothetical protein
MKNTDILSALRERLDGSAKFAERAEQIMQIVRGKEPLRCGMPVEVERAAGRTAPNGAEYHTKIRASTDAIARDAGIVPMAAWERGGLKNFNANPVILAFHSHRDPIGISTYTELDANVMTQYWLFHQESETSRMMKSLYEKGFMRAASVGFLVHEWQFVDEMSDDELENLVTKYGAAAIKDVYWVAKRAELLETSAVPVPSDPNALAFGFAARNAEAVGIDVSELARLSGNDYRGLAMKVDEKKPENAAATAEATRTTDAPAIPAVTAAPDALAEVRAALETGFTAIRDTITKLTERIAVLENGAASAAPAAGTPASSEGTAAADAQRDATSGVKISVEKRSGETDEQAIARHVDEVVRKMTGAPVPSK